MSPLIGAYNNLYLKMSIHCVCKQCIDDANVVCFCMCRYQMLAWGRSQHEGLLQGCVQTVSLLQLQEHLQQPHIGMLTLGLLGNLDIDLYICFHQCKALTCCFGSSICCLRNSKISCAASCNESDPGPCFLILVSVPEDRLQPGQFQLCLLQTCHSSSTRDEPEAHSQPANDTFSYQTCTVCWLVQG